MTDQQKAILKLNNSDFPETEKAFLVESALRALPADLANEVLMKMIEVDLSKALFWNFQENMRDLICECERFSLVTSQMFALAARQHDW